MCSFLSLYASKHSESNHGDVKSDFTEMDGIYLSMCEKSVCLKASQAISGHMQSRIVSQCMLPKLLFKASQFDYFKFFFWLPFCASHLTLPQKLLNNGQTYRDTYPEDCVVCDEVFTIREQQVKGSTFIVGRPETLIYIDLAQAHRMSQ